ncbi:hypothetical protein [Streptomyces sp. F-1]|uniref:hypothetical protein n=1 Tax=Streptomyces sp. F-1 TaxID=463642 RepID=UPI00085C0B45|nr:hypothetical protein [Streptomyces sp. F-1]SFY51168.1 hypothetical protein STEPF1_04425 [Streptomyces sp. F-1]
MAKKTTTPAAAADPRFENGPLAAIHCEDGQVSGYCVGGLVLDVPAKSVPSLVDWTLTEARLGQARLHRNGRDADRSSSSPRPRWSATACPPPCRRKSRARDGWRPATRYSSRSSGPDSSSPSADSDRGPGVYRDPEGSQRRCVQLCILPWNAAGASEWDKRDDPKLPTMHPADLARHLGLCAARVTTPRGSTATTGLELMTEPRPPTRAEKAPDTGEFKQASNDDALTAVYDAANTRSARPSSPGTTCAPRPRS